MARGRSPNYPAVGLSEALDMVAKLHAAERRTPVPYELAAKAIGYQSLSGPARVKVSTLRKYGLVDEAGGKVRVSDLAMQILYPRSEQQKQAGLEQAAYKPELYRDLAPLADGSDANLVNHLVQMGFTDQGARQALVAFRETMSLVGAAEGAYDDSESEGRPMLDQPNAASAVPFPTRSLGARADPTRAAADYVWPLPGGIRVELRFAGGPFTKAGLRVLQEYLRIVEKTIPDGEESGGASLPEAPSAPEPPA